MLIGSINSREGEEEAILAIPKEQDEEIPNTRWKAGKHPGERFLGK